MRFTVRNIAPGAARANCPKALGWATLLGLVLLPAPAIGVTGSSTANVGLKLTVIASCALDTPPALDFGHLDGGKTLASDLSTQVNLSVTCDFGTPYMLYLGGGANRQTPTSGLRRMQNADTSALLPYQLYKADLTTVWDDAGLPSATGTGGVAGTGTGSAQSWPVYAVIPHATVIPLDTGDYTDTVTVTVAY
jgi:spore coat protein U-like protein